MACYLVTGGAGFIGSHLVRALLNRGDTVRVLDDFSTGRRDNCADFRDKVTLHHGSILDKSKVAEAMAGVDYCLHQAAIPSVPRSIAEPVESNRANVEGSINVFLAARDAGVKRVCYASSSAVYGNAREMPAHEDLPLLPISPYGVSKAADEMYANCFSDLYDIDIVGLRYFNVFGPRQDPTSQYAAVIPIFVTKMLAGERPPIDGDGTQSRDFTYIDNVVSANLMACEAPGRIAGVYNVACGGGVSIIELVRMLNEILGTSIEPDFQSPRPGDIKQSFADIARARAAFGYEPAITVRHGLAETVAWFRQAMELA